MKIITNEQIELILEKINERRIHEVKKELRSLKDDPLRDKLKRLIIEQGKTNLISKDKIEELLNDNL